MNQVSFGNGVPTRTQVAVHSVGAQSTDGESSEAVAASDTMTQSAAEMGYAQDAGQMSATARGHRQRNRRQVWKFQKRVGMRWKIIIKVRLSIPCNC